MATLKTVVFFQSFHASPVQWCKRKHEILKTQMLRSIQDPKSFLFLN